MIPGPVVERLSTNARFRIECAGGLPDGLAPTLCVKGYFGEKGRAMVHVGEPEARFYAVLAEATGVRTFRAAYADVDPKNRHGVVITEDVVAAGGESWTRCRPTRRSRPRRASTELARLHARQLGPERADERAVARVTALDLLRRTAASTTSRPTSMVRSASTSHPRSPTPSAWPRLHARWPHAPRGRLDGDPRRRGRRQHLRRRAGRAALVDWQVVQRGHWGIDVGYHIASALTTADRERFRA